MRYLLILFAVLICVPAAASTPQVDTPEESRLLSDPPAVEPAPRALDPDRTLLHFRVDPEAYSIISAARGLSLHKPMYAYPVSYSRAHRGSDTELVFQFSAKHRLFGEDLYFGYTQKSFWEIYNGADSRPFRETNYNPELFYRLQPDPERWHHWGLDLGIEHESNGQSTENSRSWNRIYAAAFQARGRSLLYLKTWYRIPERAKRSEDDAGGDDNPDINRFYGYGEVHYARQLGNRQLASLMVRGNPATGKGALSLTYSIPTRDGRLFYAASLWHGYGESLIDYNNSVTRLMLGVMLAR